MISVMAIRFLFWRSSIQHCSESLLGFGRIPRTRARLATINKTWHRLSAWRTALASTARHLDRNRRDQFFSSRLRRSRCNSFSNLMSRSICRWKVVV